MICMACGGSDIHRTCICNYGDSPRPYQEWEDRMIEGNHAGFHDAEECLRASLARFRNYDSIQHDGMPYDTLNIAGRPKLEWQPKQICHFCGVDLFLPDTDLNIRMCVPCGIQLDNSECGRCVRCNRSWLLAEENCSVCETCRSL